MTAAVLERLILDAWPARERGAFGGWTLLADGGVTGRVNAVAPLGFDLEGVDQSDRSVTVIAADGRQVVGDILIGADGINSAVRRQVFGSFEAIPSGRIAARAVIAAEPNSVEPNFVDTVDEIG